MTPDSICCVDLQMQFTHHLSKCVNLNLWTSHEKIGSRQNSVVDHFVKMLCCKRLRVQMPLGLFDCTLSEHRIVPPALHLYLSIDCTRTCFVSKNCKQKDLLLTLHLVHCEQNRVLSAKIVNKTLFCWQWGGCSAGTGWVRGVVRGGGTGRGRCGVRGTGVARRGYNVGNTFNLESRAWKGIEL